jgi:hypothetical protein
MEKTLSDKAHVNVKIIYALDRHTSMDKFSVMQELNLPEALGDKNLPKYEIKGSFRADVPWDFSKELKNARDLTKISDIEERIVRKYRQLSRMLKDADAYNIIREREHSFLRTWNYNYFTKEEVPALPESEDELYDLNLRGREMAPMANYEIVYFHHNKVAVLRDKDSKSSLLKVYYWEDEEDEKAGEEKSNSYSFAALYMPAGSDELKIW